MIRCMLTRLEQLPSTLFSEHELRTRFPTEFDECRRVGLIRRLPLPSGVGAFSTSTGQRYVAIPEDNGYAAFDEDDVESPPNDVGPEALAQWRLDLDAVAVTVRRKNGLTGKPGTLSERLYFVGESSPDRAAVLALLLNDRLSLPLLYALPTLTPLCYNQFLVVCPSFEPPPGERRRLESLGLAVCLLDPSDPFRLPLWPHGVVNQASTSGQDQALFGFEHSDTYNWVLLRGREFLLGDPQAKAIEDLHRAYLSGAPDLPWRKIAAQLPTQPANMSDLFRAVPDWGELIVQKRRGLYRLNL